MKIKNIKLEVNLGEIERNRELTSLFAHAMCDMDIAELDSLLHEEYKYHDKSKIDFLNWLHEKFAENLDNGLYFMPVKMRYCLSCKPGNPTLLFNQGFFPKEVDGCKGQKGFMLDFKAGKISDITICYKWCNERELNELCQMN